MCRIVKFSADQNHQNRIKKYHTIAAMNNKVPDQYVQMLRLIWPFDVCIAKGRFSCLEAPSIDDLTQVKSDYAYANIKKSRPTALLHKLISLLNFHCSDSIIFQVFKFEISYFLPSYITYLSGYIKPFCLFPICS